MRTALRGHSDVVVFLTKVEPMTGLEPVTYALRKRLADLGITLGDHSNLDPEKRRFFGEILPKLSEKILMILRAVESVCYACATAKGERARVRRGKSKGSL